MAKIKFQSKRFESKRKSRKIYLSLGIAICVGILVYGISGLTKISAFQITDITVIYSDKSRADIMKAAAMDALSGEYFGLFPRSNRFIYPKGDIARAVSSTSLEIKSVVINNLDAKTLVITAYDKIPHAYICIDLPEIDELTVRGSECYVVDEAGLVYKSQNNNLGEINTYFMVGMNDHVSVGTNIRAVLDYGKLQDLFSSLNHAGIVAKSLLVDPLGDYEIYALNPSGKSMAVIRFSGSMDINEQKENLLAYWRKMVSDYRAKNNVLEWEEIKLNYPPNVYARVRE